jgi:hypothetical protein
MKRSYYKYYFVLLAASLILFAQSCDDSLTSSDIDNIVIPEEAGLDLSSWLAATSDPSIIARGSDSTSILVWTIEGFPPYPQMPPPGRMKENHIQGIRTWIREGALNN